MDPFLGEIRAVGFSFAPARWALCQGQLMSISQNTALFALLGTQYGGDGRSSFALPNLMGRVAVNSGTGQGLSQIYQGEMAGVPSVTLDQTQMPAHVHPLSGVQSPLGTSDVPGTTVALSGGGGRGTGHPFYTMDATKPVNMLPPGIAGGSQPHNNMGTYLALNYIISLSGVFPPRS